MLNNLTTKKNIRTFSICPENLTGEKGKGAMATRGTAEYASRELGVGWKVNPYLVAEPGAIITLADYKGMGSIKHFWLTDSAERERQLILRIYFDGAKNPQVECPVSDFFCSADYREFRQLSSLCMCVNPARGLNCYFEMPFFKGFKITIENQGEKSACIYYQIDCEEKGGAKEKLSFI